jgi:CTP:molybdopterin cytidylyltransferase MocA
VIDELVDALTDEKSIAACAHAGTLETPSAFGRFCSDDLTSLPNDTGAKVLLMKYHDAVVSVSFSAGAVDADTAIDYAQW